MNVILVGPDPGRRHEVATLLAQCEVSVASFSDPRTAFLFLLGRVGEVDGVLIDEDDANAAAWLRDRLELLPEDLATVSYSGRDPTREATISSRGGAPAELAGLYPALMREESANRAEEWAEE